MDKFYRELDGLLTLISHHNAKNQEFNTLWLHSYTSDHIRQMVGALKNFGYVTVEKQERKSERRYLLAAIATILGIVFVILDRFG